MNAAIVMSESGDWEGLYIDGFLVLEGHSLSARQVLEAMKIPTTWRSAPSDYFDNNSRLPERLKDLDEQQ